MDKHDVAWAAGFFEGEGTVGCRLQMQNNKPYYRLVANVTQTFREPLDKFQEIFGTGKVRGPYGPYSGNRQPHFQYNISGKNAVEVLEKMLPYLFHKGEQTREALAKYKEYTNA
jgi:hypothetical protein